MQWRVCVVYDRIHCRRLIHAYTIDSTLYSLCCFVQASRDVRYYEREKKKMIYLLESFPGERDRRERETEEERKRDIHIRIKERERGTRGEREKPSH